MRFDYDRFKETCFHEIFEYTVERFPTKTALYWCVDRDEISVLSYQTLNQRANQLANYLNAIHQKQNLHSKPIIAVCMEQGVNYIIGLIAIWKAGLIYYPLDPIENASTIQQKLKQIHCKHVIFDYPVQQKMPTNFENMILTNLEDKKTRDQLVKCSIENLSNVREITEDAYLMTSSGTTGLPKMIMNSMEGLPGRIHGVLRHFKLEPNHTVLGFSNYHFDASVFDICLAFSTASALFVVPEYARQDILGELHYLLDLAKEKNINICQAALIPEVINKIDADQHCFRYLITMGAKANWGQLKKLITRGTRVFDGYGPTETTIAATMRELTPNSPLGIVSTDQSKAIEGVLPGVIFGLVKKENKKYKLISNTEDAQGEIILGGKGVGYYWDNDALNQARFIRFPKLGPGRFYLTGDIAEYKNGTLQISGRNNREIKIQRLC